MLHHAKTNAPIKEPTSYELAILNGLQSKQVWAGGYKQPRAKARAANKVARRSRRINRGR